MSEHNKSLTFYLFARPSFIEGMARLVDWSNALQIYNYSKDGSEADKNATGLDWKTVGNDLRAALQEYERTEQAAR